MGHQTEALAGSIANLLNQQSPDYEVLTEIEDDLIRSDGVFFEVEGPGEVRFIVEVYPDPSQED
jgi:hypothetical protein